MKIVVLMSTYNGEKYLKQQINSILNQTIVQNNELKLLVRDDGSRDRTIKILEEYEEKALLSFYVGNNIGVAASFWELIHKAPDADFYAFSDQDDVWFEDKLECAVDKIKNNLNSQLPALYIGTFVSAKDEEICNGEYQLKNIGINRNTIIDYSHSLIFSYGPGCTFVFNKNSLEEYKKIDYNSYHFFMHDWMASKISLIKGEIFVDDRPMMYYRQHADNVIGDTSHGFCNYISRAKKIIFGETLGVRSCEAKILLDIYSAQMTESQKSDTDVLATYKKSLKNKIVFIKNKNFKNHNNKDFVVTLLALFNRL